MMTVKCFAFSTNYNDILCNFCNLQYDILLEMSSSLDLYSHFLVICRIELHNCIKPVLIFCLAIKLDMLVLYPKTLDADSQRNLWRRDFLYDQLLKYNKLALHH